jgi:hypothetical protein
VSASERWLWKGFDAVASTLLGLGLFALPAGVPVVMAVVQNAAHLLAEDPAVNTKVISGECHWCKLWSCSTGGGYWCSRAGVVL